MGGITYNQLKPYEDWEKFRDEFRKLFDIYQKDFSFGVIERVGLRYINRIEIPSSFFELEDYFKTFPAVSKKLPQSMSEFFFRLILRNSKKNLITVVNQTIDTTYSDEKRTAIVFDIDVSTAPSFQVKIADFWTFIEEVKDEANLIFFESITDKTKSLLK